MTETRFEKAQRLLNAGKVHEDGESVKNAYMIRREFDVEGDTGTRRVDVRVFCDCNFGINGKVCSHILACLMSIVKVEE